MAIANPLPPGGNGLPLLGETLAFANNPFAFIHQRRARFGDVFRTSILGSQTVFFVGPRLAETYIDPANIQREGAMPANILALFGGNLDIVPLLDGEAHAQRKRSLLAAFSREAVAGYLPGLQSRIETLLAKWLARGQGPVTADLKTLAIESLSGAIFSLAPGEELSRLLADNAILGKAFVALPINLPGTPYAKGLKARDRILALLEGIARRHIDSPPAEPDGLTRILAAAREAGAPLDARTAAREMHHFLLAGLIVFAELAATLRALQEHPEVRERLRAEVLANAPAGAIGPAQLRAMPYLMQVVDEVKRTCPNVPMSFGRARRDIDVAGYTVRAGRAGDDGDLREQSRSDLHGAGHFRPRALLSGARREEARARRLHAAGRGRPHGPQMRRLRFRHRDDAAVRRPGAENGQLGAAGSGPVAQMGNSAGAQERPRRPLG